MRLLKLVPPDTRIDFLGRWRWAIGFTATSTIASILLLITVGLNFGIDFRGGTAMIVQTPQPVAVSELRAAVAGLNVGEIQVTEIGGGVTDAKPQALVRIVEQGDDPDVQAAAIQAVRDALTRAVPGLTVQSVESVGGKVSAELVEAGVLAVVLAVLAVMVYVWLRFEWQFAVGAVVSLVHDVLLTLGLFALLQIEFNLPIVAAILTIIGYSLNDTVIVFDRVRENLRKYKKMPLAELINMSVNETLSRTIMTSFTTLLALIALYVIGGPVISGFTFAMIWGVVIGTYSSIFVAGVVLNWLGVDRSDKPSAKAGTQFADIDA
ncbi:MAG: protein translocase subunit SecF [Alphaproteobacteria bacterium]|nr:MAG: protein translocase subunit SecF [Alphaproteobacteria bacterium]